MFENVNHPIKDGIIADNSTLSSRKIKEMVENATELPTPAAGDNGKVLTVNSDLKYDLEAIPTPESDIFYFDVFLLQASTSSVPDGHEVALTGVTGTSFDDVKSALDAGKRIIARISIFDQIPFDITFTVQTHNYTIKKGDIHFMDFGGYIQGKTGAPMFYKGYFPAYDYPTQGGSGFHMLMFTPDNGTGINKQVTVFLESL